MPKDKSLVEPRILKGFQDLLPEDLIHRKDVIRRIENIFERYGFIPLESPALEHLDVLLGAGGEDTNKELFTLQSPEGDDISLRFDLTVPFARMLAQYPDKLKTPVRRYAIGPVWRADKPGPGRFRQFTQFDVDVAGADSVGVDAEIIAIMCEIMQELNAPGFRVNVSNRKLVDALLRGCGIEDDARQKHILRVIDKLAKIGVDNVRLELGEGRIDKSGDPIPGVHLDTEAIENILGFVAVKGDTRSQVLENIAAVLPESDIAAEAIGEMKELAEILEAIGIEEEHVRFDPSLTRGLDYYTGPVFETVIPKARKFGSVMGGGRYDHLVERFLDRPVPCTGMSVGLDRLMAALTKVGALTPSKSTVQVLIVSLGNIPVTEILTLANELRKAGIRTEAYFGKKKRMGDQLSHADRYEIPIAVILGEDELSKGEVSIKDLHAGKKKREHIEDRQEYREAGTASQLTVPRGDLIDTVRNMLEPKT